MQVNTILLQHVDEINETSGNMTLEGFISLDGAHSKVEYCILVRGKHS